MSEQKQTGRVTLVGGGPGAADLITVRGLDRLMAADVVICDRLAPRELLDRLAEHVEIVDAARYPDHRSLTHEQIVEVMLARVETGKHVVRLKGGDPAVFAHGDQEATALAAAGVTVEVVPGVTSATAAAVLAGVPLTGAKASGFTVVSGHRAPSDPHNTVAWDVLARSGTTLVVLMGMKQLAAIAERLVQAGMDPRTAASCVAEASLPGQRHLEATLETIASAVTEAGLGNPAVVVIAPSCTTVTTPTPRVLVLGGSRSGKSAFAESLLGPGTTYLATAPDRPQDEEWATRIAAHRARRPADWTTVESGDLAGALASDESALLADSVTTWLSRAMDESGFWEGRREALAARVEALVAAWEQCATTAVLVSDEVGSGIVPSTPAGRAFRDELGVLNQRLAASADQVFLVTAGIARRLR